MIKAMIYWCNKVVFTGGRLYDVLTLDDLQKVLMSIYDHPIFIRSDMIDVFKNTTSSQSQA